MLKYTVFKKAAYFAFLVKLLTTTSVCPCLDQCVCLWLMVAPKAHSVFCTMTALDGSIRSWDARGSGEEEGMEWWRKGRFEGRMTDFPGLSENAPLILISCSILRSSRRDVSSAWMLTDDQTRGHSQTWWMGFLHRPNGYTTSTKTGVKRKDKGLPITGGQLH